MKKVLFIGDIHGRTDWRETALEGLKKFEEVVFLGDYFDSFDISSVKQIDNFKALLSFIEKKKNVTALLGNHDYAYIHGFSSISGYQFPHAHQIQQLLREHLELFRIAWGYTDEKEKYTLATHAGLTYDFWKRHILPLFEEGFLQNITAPHDPKDLKIHEILNYLIDKKELMWKVGSMRGGIGTPGPLWADYRELSADLFPNINQVFGHTASHAPSVDFLGDIFIARIDNFGGKVASLVLGI